MSVNNLELKRYLDGTLRAHEISDYCPNGLQVEGNADIQRVITGVTASQALIDAAIAQNADAIVVHHGYFWKGESQAISGMKKSGLRHCLNTILIYLHTIYR